MNTVKLTYILFSSLFAFSPLLEAGGASAVLTMNTVLKTLTFTGLVSVRPTYNDVLGTSTAMWYSTGEMGGIVADYTLTGGDIIADTLTPSASSNKFSLYQDESGVMFSVVFAGNVENADLYGTGVSYVYSGWSAEAIACLESVLGAEASLMAAGVYPSLVVTVISVPEPAACAALCGLGVLGLAIVRRQRVLS